MSTQAAPPAANGVARLPIDEAARLLGVSRATVRRRLRSGGLKGVQVATPHGRKWLVDVVSHLDSPNGVTLDTQGDANASGEPPCSPGAPAPADAFASPAAPAREVELLQAHVDDLRRQLEDRTREVGQLHTLLAQAHARLTSGSQVSTLGESAAPQTQNDLGQRVDQGRRWWQRLLWG